MTFTVATEPFFATDMLNGVVDPRASMLRYGMLADDVTSLITGNLNISGSQLLSGMLRAKRIVGLTDADITCAPVGSLSSVDDRYLKLALCCGHTLVCDQPLSVDDSDVLTQNDVTRYNGSNVDFESILFDRTNNAIQTWSLTEGGNLSSSDVLATYFKRAAAITIYDRFFDSDALLSVESAILTASGGLPLSCDILVLIGRGDGKQSEAAIEGRLSAALAGAGSVTVTKCTKSPTSRHFLHDRYVQIDNAYTFVFPAGLSCFICSSGLNRASTILLNDLFISHVVAELIRLDNGSDVKLKY